MGLVDALLAREHHTLRSTESIEACRQLIGNGVHQYVSAPSSPRPFFVRWSGLDSVQMWSAGNRRRGLRRALRVHLTPDGFGTCVEVTTQISGLSLRGVRDVESRYNVGKKPDGLLEDLAYVLHASSIDGVATPEFSSTRSESGE